MNAPLELELAVCSRVLGVMLERGLVTSETPPRATPALRITPDWTPRSGSGTAPRTVPHVSRAQAGALLRMRDPRTREHVWKRLHPSVRGALVRNGLCYRDLEPTPLGELVSALADQMLGPAARAAGRRSDPVFCRTERK